MENGSRLGVDPRAMQRLQKELSVNKRNIKKPLSQRLSREISGVSLFLIEQKRLADHLASVPERGPSPGGKIGFDLGVILGYSLLTENERKVPLTFDEIDAAENTFYEDLIMEGHNIGPVLDISRSLRYLEGNIPGLAELRRKINRHIPNKDVSEGLDAGLARGILPFYKRAESKWLHEVYGELDLR